MGLALVFIVIGLFLLLNAMGIIIASNFWTLLWAIIFLSIGIRLIIKKGKCPICGWHNWKGKMPDNCECDCNCGENQK